MTGLVQTPAPRFKDQYGLTAFVETGCFLGEALKYAVALGFSDLYSCDLNPKYIEDCQVKFPAVKFVHGESQVALREILAMNDKPTLFWLDAHLPIYHDIPQPNKISKWPLYEELIEIAGRKDICRDVIMFDDARNIIRNNPNAILPPDIDADHCVSFIDYEKVRRMFQATHTFSDTICENVGIFLPKIE